MYQGSLKGVSWQFQLCFKKVSRVFKESAKCVPRKFQIKFQEFSNTFLQFLLLHGSHRSYLSRRRACLDKNGLKMGSNIHFLLFFFHTKLVKLLIFNIQKSPPW